MELVFDKFREEYQVVGYKQFDSTEPIKAVFLSNGEPIDLSQYYIRFECKKPDGNIVIDDENIITKDICKIEMLINEQVTVVNGDVECQFVLVHKENERQNTTFTFEINIQQSVIGINGYSASLITVAERLSKDIVIATKLHETLTDDIELGNLTSEDLVAKTIEGNNTVGELVAKTNTGNETVNQLVEKTNIANQKKIEIEASTQVAIEKNDLLVDNTRIADDTNIALNQAITQASGDIAKINATGNKSLIIGGSQFVNNEYTWTHNMNSKDLNIDMFDSETDEPLMLDCKLVDKNNILIRNSVEHPNIKVVLSASYYQGNSMLGTTVEDFVGDSIGVGIERVRLKDNNGVVKNPVTDSDAVYMTDGTTKLTKKISDIGSSLEQKANELEVVKKGQGTLNDFNEETRALLQGLPEGETNINAVLGEDNVTTYNLSGDIKNLFIDKLENYAELFNGSINDTTGQLVDSAIRVRTNLISFNVGDIIYSTNFKFYILEYTSDGVFKKLVQAFTNKYRFVNNIYVRVVIGKNDNSNITTTDVLNQININKTSLFNYSNKAIDDKIKISIDNRTMPLITTSLNEGNPSVGSLSTTDGSNVVSSTRARTNKLLKFSIGDIVKCSVNEKFYGIEYTKDGAFSKVLFNFTNSYTFVNECYIKFVFAYNDNSTITDVKNLASLITIQSANNFNYSNTQIEEMINIHKKVLEGKIWAVVGDSTTDSNVHTALKYHYWVAQDTRITVLDFGKSGTGYKRTEEKGTAFYQRVANLPSNVDVVTIFGSGNDCSQNYTVGEVTDSTTDTWCGCVNKTIDTILERCPTCNIALVSPYQWGIYPTSTDNKMKELSNKLKEIADYRGFEFLDLYRRASVRPNDVTFNNTYFYNGDKVHLNDKGHKKFLYPKFKQLVLRMVDYLS